MNTVEVEIISKETIKPSSPTPYNLRNFKLSILDQLAPFAYVPFIFFYAPTKSKTIDTVNILQLKVSLSETLTRFYPVAGRVENNLLIYCNDEGVDFLEAKISCPLSRIVDKPEAEVLNQFLPQGYNKSPIRVQFATQVNVFSCGGMAIGMCFLHKLFDGSTIGSFINDWASSTTGGVVESSPIFLGPFLFPPRDMSNSKLFVSRGNAQNAKCITKRFVFDGSKIASLREKVASNSCLDRPSRTEVVSALIWKCAMEVRRKQKSGTSLSPSLATQTVNLRPRMEPPLAEKCAGNMLWLAIAAAPAGTEDQIELHDLVAEMRNEVRKFDVKYVKKMQGENGSFMISESFKKRIEVFSKYRDVYMFTSLHHFPLYEVDFGWGKPVWISSAAMEFKNVIVLMDTASRDGIEAWVTMEEEDMPIFQELLA